MNDRIREADAYPTDSYDWDYDYQARPRSKVLWGRVVILAVVLLLAFFLGRSTASNGGVSEEDFDRLQAQFLEAQDQIAQLEEENDQLQANTIPANGDQGGNGAEGEEDNTDTADEANSSTYVVGEDQTLVEIAAECYGDTSLDTWIMEANEITDATLIRVQQELTIPPHPTTGEAPTC